MPYQPGALLPRSDRAYARRRKRFNLPVICLMLVLLLALAGCANDSSGYLPTIPASPGTSQQGAGAGTATPGSSYVQLTDLSNFRLQLSVAFSSNNWSKVSRYLSPEFSFQGANTGGNSMLMPDSEIDLSALYKSQGPWSLSSQHQVAIHFCDAGSTPLGQQMGFDGGRGSFILVGIDRWQGFWLVFWAFQDPNGGDDACASS
jgi:hypothetical protein